MTTTNGVAAQDTNTELDAFSVDDASDAFLNRWSEQEPEDNESSSEDTETPDEELPEETSDEETEGETAEEEVEGEEESETDPEEESEEAEDQEDGEEEDTTEKKVLDDKAVVKVKVGDDELEVSVSDLKRLYGQEAALTRKSQQVAETRKAVEADGQKLAASLERMYKKAEERYKPYAELDMMVASKQLDVETFTALRKEAQEAYEDFQFISSEVDAFVAHTNQQRQVQQAEAAKEAVKVLKDKIPNWSPALYDSIREYAVSVGMPKEAVDGLTNPLAIEMMHKARLYDESKKIATKKKVASPKRIVKTTAPINKSSGKAELIARKQTQLRNSGSTDDAANLFMSRWESEE